MPRHHEKFPRGTKVTIYRGNEEVQSFTADARGLRVVADIPPKTPLAEPASDRLESPVRDTR